MCVRQKEAKSTAVWVLKKPLGKIQYKLDSWYYVFLTQSSVNSQPSEANHAETTPLLNKPSSHKAQQSSLARLKEFLPFLGVFAPMVVFWAIFYQQNSTWILQGTQMDCYLGKLHVPPGIILGNTNTFVSCHTEMWCSSQEGNLICLS